jgi:hypothetical protein
VERVERNHGVEVVAGGVPLLERRGDDLHAWERRQLPPREVGKSLSELDADDLEPAVGERQGCLAGSAADLEKARPWLELRKRNQIVEELFWRDGPRTVVELRRVVEGSPEEVRIGISDPLGHRCFPYQGGVARTVGA